MNRKIIAGIFLLAILGLFAFRDFSSRFVNKRSFTTGPAGNVYIIVDKSDYELQVYDDEGWYATYPVVFGSKSLEDKMMEGDRRTPEGTFRIVNKRMHSKWHKFMLLDYPTRESWDKFNRRKTQGVISKNSRIGGAIGIHGTWPNDHFLIDNYTNWTQGCVSLRNTDIDEIFAYIQPGTRVIIRK